MALYRFDSDVVTKSEGQLSLQEIAVLTKRLPNPSPPPFAGLSKRV
jgi:hypothetical protein